MNGGAEREKKRAAIAAETSAKQKPTASKEKWVFSIRYPHKSINLVLQCRFCWHAIAPKITIAKQCTHAGQREREKNAHLKYPEANRKPNERTKKKITATTTTTHLYIYIFIGIYSVRNIKLIYKIRILANNWQKRENYPIMRFLLLLFIIHLEIVRGLVTKLSNGIYAQAYAPAFSHAMPLTHSLAPPKNIPARLTFSKTAKTKTTKAKKKRATATTNRCFDVWKHVILWTNACTTHKAKRITLY